MARVRHCWTARPVLGDLHYAWKTAVSEALKWLFTSSFALCYLKKRAEWL